MQNKQKNWVWDLWLKFNGRTINFIYLSISVFEKRSVKKLSWHYPELICERRRRELFTTLQSSA